MRLGYAVKFVADMRSAVAFHKDVLGLELRFQSSLWSEFATGETILALHPANLANPPGSVQLGYSVEDVAAFRAEAAKLGVAFSPPSLMEGYTPIIVWFVDCEGAECSVSAAGARKP
jgi:predicted enzyme related to lactoylglutathione lyase